MELKMGNEICYVSPKRIKIVVERVNEHPEKDACHCHKVEDEFVFDFERRSQNFCAAAFHSL